MGKETGMLHVTPRARNGQRAKVAAKEVCGVKTRASRKETYAHGGRTRMSHDVPAARPFTHSPLSTQLQKRKPGPTRKKTETHNKAEAGKRCMSGRRVEERVKSNEATKGTRGSQRPRGARTGKGTRQAHGEHNTAPRHRRGEHRRNKGGAAPSTTTRTAQTPHTPHTPNEPRQPAQQWAGSRERYSA